MEALLLKSEDLPHGQICHLLGVSANTLRSYLRDFQCGGVDALQRFDSDGSACELNQQLVQQIAPRLTGPQDVQNRVEHLARIASRTARPGRLGTHVGDQFSVVIR